MTRAVDELWTTVLRSPYVDAAALASAIEAAIDDESSLDYRTRLLVRDAVRALEMHWGAARCARWLAGSPVREKIERARDPDHFDKDPDEVGFPSLARRVVDATKPEEVLEFFTEL